MIEAVKKVPPEASADGRRNAYHVSCEVMGHNRPYAACLRLCNSPKNSVFVLLYSECTHAIERGNCPAERMRLEEKEKGEAIYFVERIQQQTSSVAFGSYVTKQVNIVSNAVKGITTSVSESFAPKSIKSKTLVGSIDTGNYADAINSKMNITKDQE